MASCYVFPIVLGSLTADDITFCVCIEEAGGYLLLLAAVSNLRTYFIRKFEEERHN